VVAVSLKKKVWFVGTERAAVEPAGTAAVAVARSLVAPAAGASPDGLAALLWVGLLDVPDFAGPAETEAESWSALSAEAMPAACGHASENPTTTVAAPARAPRWRIDINPPASPRLVVASALILGCAASK
jgi:hypothetical protein